MSANLVERLLESVDAQREAVDWAVSQGNDVARAWRSCPRGDWVLLLALGGGAEGSLVALACFALAGALALVLSTPRV